MDDSTTLLPLIGVLRDLTLWFGETGTKAAEIAAELDHLL